MKPLALSLVLIAFAVFPAAGQDQEGGHDATMKHRFENAERWAERFDAPERAAWQKPQQVGWLLGIEAGQTVADLGCGTGYFLRTLSAMVDETGRVYAVDIEQGMLDHAMARNLPFDNVVPVLAEPDDPKLPAGELDLILTVNTWHHIDRRIRYLGKLAAALKPFGRLVIIDWHEGELPEGPPAGHKLSRDAVVRELNKAGWTLTSESVALPYQYLLIFESPGH
jgi:SAM-dependent methyltransferase